MVAIAGLRGTGDWGADERPKNFRESILWLSPNGDAPLTALTAKMKKSSVDDPQFHWWEETLNIVTVQLNDGTNMAAGDTAVVVDSGALDLKPGDLLMVERFGQAQASTFAVEVIRVTAVASDTAFTAARGQAGSTAAVIEDNSKMTLIGSAYEEGTLAPNSTTRNPTKFYNYTQIFKDAYSITNTAKATYARTGDPVANDKKRKMFDHSTRMELAFIFGQRYENAAGAVNGKPERYTGGFLYFLSQMSPSRITVKSAAYVGNDMNELFDDLADVFDYTSSSPRAGDERILLCGNGFLNSINKMSTMAGTINFGDTVKVYGMNFATFRIPQGTFYLKSHPLMSRHLTYTNSAMVLNPPGLNYRPLKGRDTKPDDNIQLPGEDAQKGQWIGEVGLEFHHLQTMKFLTNVSWTAS